MQTAVVVHEEFTFFRLIHYFFEIVDYGLLVVCVLGQATLINHFFFLKEDSSKAWLLWYVMDLILLLGMLGALYLSYNHLQMQIPPAFHFPFLMRMRISPHGVLPYGPLFWAPYSVILTAKISLLAYIGALDNLPHHGWWTPHTFQMIVGIAVAVILLLLKTFRDPKIRLNHHIVEYLSDIGSKTALEILDSIDMLANVFEEDVIRYDHLVQFIVILSGISLFLPTISLTKLAMDDSKERERPVSISLVYSTCRLALVDCPYLFIRGYLASTGNEAMSLFALKNILNILAETRYLVPAYIGAYRKKHGISSTENEV